MKVNKCFNKIIGQTNIKKILSMIIDIHRKETKKEAILLVGASGHGKTTLARIFAKELGFEIVESNANAITTKKELISLLGSLKQNSILFIDEIHSLPKYFQEILYTAFDDYKITMNVGTKDEPYLIKVKINSFILIGATTDYGSLLEPLINRFTYIGRLNFYHVDEIAMVIKPYFDSQNIEISAEDTAYLANFAKRVPRNGINIAQKVIDYSKICQNSKIKRDDIDSVLESLEIFNLGLNNNDVSFLKLLKENEKPLGLSSIAKILTIEEKTILNSIEPFLLKEKLIEKGNLGREITDLGTNYLRKLL